VFDSACAIVVRSLAELHYLWYVLLSCAAHCCCCWFITSVNKKW